MKDDARKTKSELSAELSELRRRVAELETSQEAGQRAREALLASEERLSLALNTVQDGLWDWDATTGRVYRSPGWYTMLGYEPGSLPETEDTWYEHVHPDDLDRVMLNFNAHLDGRIPCHDCEYRLRAKDGSWRWIRDRGQVVARDPSGKVLRMVGAQTDITAWKEAQETLQQYQDHLEELFQERTRALEQGITALARSDEKLRIQTEVLQNVLLHVPHAIFWKDRNFAFLGCNMNFARNAGANSPEDLVGRTDRDCPWSEEQADFYQRIDKQVMDHGLVWIDQEEPQRRADGSEVVLLTSKVPLHDAAGNVMGVLGIYVDITERKRAEEALKENQRRLATLMSNLPGMVYRCRNDESYTMEFVSEGGRELTGYPPEALVGNRDRSYADLIHPDDRARVWQTVQDALQAQAPFIIEYRLRAANGCEKWVWERGQGIFSTTGELQALEGFISDMTETRRAEWMLRLARFSIDHVSDGVFWVNESGFFFYANDAACRMLGYTREELTQMRVSDIDPDFPAERWPIHIADLKAFGSLTFESQHVTKDGRCYPVEINANYLEFEGEVYVLTFVRDISSRKRAEEERQRLEAQVQHAQKLESLGVLAGGIAHDFNNLLMGILGNADMAQHELSPVSPARLSVMEIETAAKRAAELTRQLLAYSGKGRFVIEAINLSELVEEMAHLLEVSISKKATLKYHFASDLPSVLADAAQIRQVVMNLIINASEAIGTKSGIIAVTTGAIDCDRSYLRSTYLDEELPEGLYVYLEVSDTGCGMDQDTLGRIFDPFFTTKFTGRGLGLAAVLGIVRGHQGALKVYSEPGRGTTFKVLLPAHNRPAEPLRADTTDAGGWRGQGAVLLVDDEQTVRALGKRMLERIGFRVLVAEDGLGAVALFREHAEDIVCVILDLTMPHMDGEETFRILRQICPEVPVILSSGYNEQEVTQRFVGKGLAGFIQKPYQLGNLQAKLREVLLRSEQENLPEQETAPE